MVCKYIMYMLQGERKKDVNNKNVYKVYVPILNEAFERLL